MNDISLKNEEFIKDTIETLYIVDEINASRKKLLYLINRKKNNKEVDNVEIVKNLNDIIYNKVKVEDIYDSIKSYFYNVQYQNDDLLKYQNNTRIRASIASVNISKNIYAEELIPDFSIDIVNLGFDGILEDDKIIIIMKSNATNKEYVQEYNVGQNINNLLERQTIQIEGFVCPEEKHEYTIYIQVKRKDYIYSEFKINGVNVRGY